MYKRSDINVMYTITVLILEILIYFIFKRKPNSLVLLLFKITGNEKLSTCNYFCW